MFGATVNVAGKSGLSPASKTVGYQETTCPREGKIESGINKSVAFSAVTASDAVRLTPEVMTISIKLRRVLRSGGAPVCLQASHGTELGENAVKVQTLVVAMSAE